MGTNCFNELSLEQKEMLDSTELEAYYKALREHYLKLPYNKNSRFSDIMSDSEFTNDQVDMMLKMIDRLVLLASSTKVAFHEVIYRLYSIWNSEKVRNNYDLIVVNKELLPNDKDGHIIISNHQKHLDEYIIATLFGSRPIHFMAAAEFRKFKYGIIKGILCILLGPVFVDRDNPVSRKNGRMEQTKLVLHDKLVALFPEGGRKETLSEFQPGALRIAQDSGKSIIPLAINYYEETVDGRNPVILRVCRKPIFIGPNDSILVETNDLWRVVAQGIDANDEMAEEYGYVKQKIIYKKY